MNIISFPGLGIEGIKLNKVAFTIFGKDIAWYGVIITVGIILAFLYVMSRTKIEGVKADDIYDYAIWCVISGIIGARIYYVLFKLEDFHSFYDVIAIWNGGLAIYGAVIGGAAAALIVSAVKKIKPLKILDMLSPAVMIGQILGRWGNFFNAEAYGGETDLPWRMGIQFGGVGNTYYYHPTFLYESLWNILGFLLINAFYKKKKYNGQIFFMYIAWYGLGRAFIEGMRTDSLWIGPFRISQLVGIVCFLVGAVLLLVFAITKKHDFVPFTDEKANNPAVLKTEEKPGDDTKNPSECKTDEKSDDSGKNEK